MENVLRALQQRHMLALCKDGSTLFFVKLKPLEVGEQGPPHWPSGEDSVFPMQGMQV